MAVVKTAISLQEPLFNKLVQLAEEQNLSRSRLFSLALEEYIERIENQKLFAALNAAYDDDQEEELELTKLYKRRYRKTLDEETW